MRVFAGLLIFIVCGVAQDATRGWEEFSAGRYREAKAQFEKAVRSAEGTPLDQAAALTNLGQAHLALGEVARAEKTLRKAVDLAPQSWRTWHLLGQAVVARGNAAEGEALIRKAMAMAGPDRTAMAGGENDLGVLLLKEGRRREAAEAFERATSMSPPGQARARMLTNLGGAYWALGRRREAARTLDQALGEMEAAVGPAHPDVARILDDYVAVLEKTGRKAEARTAMQRAQGLRPISPPTVDWHDLKRAK